MTGGLISPTDGRGGGRCGKGLSSATIAEMPTSKIKIQEIANVTFFDPKKVAQSRDL